LQILFEDNHLLAVNKPAGLATIGTAEDLPSLAREAKAYLKRRYKKPGNVFLGVMSRLDAPVSGVVLLARTSKAAARLNEQFRTHAVTKVYWAIVAGGLSPPADECMDWIVKNEALRRMVIATPATPGAKQARLTYRKLVSVSGALKHRSEDEASLVEVLLETGRKHQIRLQLASRGFPVIGDNKYGSRQPFENGIALHARKLVFQHPIGKHSIELTAALPECWRKHGIRDSTD